MKDDNDVIRERFLDQGDLFALRYRTGIIGLEVTGTEYLKYEPYTGFSSVSATSSSGFQRLEAGSNNNDDIIYMDKGTKKVLHVGIGHSPKVLRRYTNYPEDQNRLRTIPNLTSVSAGDDYGYVDGEDMPYEEPGTAEELWIPPNVHLNFAFYNPDDEPHTPVLKILMNEYNVRVLNPSNNTDRQALNRIVSPGSPMPIAPVGGIDSQVRFDLEQEWGTSPVPISNLRGN